MKIKLLLVLRSWVIQEDCEVQISGSCPQLTSKLKPFKASTFRKQFKFFAGIALTSVELQKQKFDL